MSILSSVNSEPSNAKGRQAAFSIASIYALRMFGLLMLVPILSLYAHTLAGATPFLIGVALGCYGLTQALLQIPFGTLSDHYGRKRIMAIGLFLFAGGSIIAALSTSIWGLILGRSLQGTAAIGSASMALLADLTRDDQRVKAMAVIGITMGFSFSFAMILGPLLNRWLSVPSIFWLTFLFAILALFILRLWVPNPDKIIYEDRNVRNITALLANFQLLRLNFGILFLHAILTANFVVLPFILHNLGLNFQEQWQIYLPALLLTFITVVPLLKFTRSSKQIQLIFLTAIVGLLLAELLLWQWQYTAWQIIFDLWLFFTAFTLIEAIIPSLVSQLAPIQYRGTAMGINSTFQFFGIFMGGAGGGWLYGFTTLNCVLYACVVLAGLWFLLGVYGRIKTPT